MSVISVKTELTDGAAMTQGASTVNDFRKSQPQLRVVLAGGSGQIGKLLCRHFCSQGHSVRVLSRQRGANSSNVLWWDGLNLGHWVRELDGADVLINLSGRSVDCRYTAVHRWEIMESRVRSTQVLGHAITRLKKPPHVWLNASTATIYRHEFVRDMNEISGEIGGAESNASRSWNFSIEVAKRWEEAFLASETPDTRKVALRSAMVMSPDRGGVFEVLLRLVRLGLGGAIGNGRQYVSWVLDTDFVRAIDHIMSHEKLTGAVNIASPGPIPNSEFMQTLRKAWGARFGMAAPLPILEIGTFLLRTESELVLKSRRVVPRRLLEDGFRFQFTNWTAAAADLVARWKNNRRQAVPVGIFQRAARNEGA
jgi:uncharacterized protein (TIGR01777 family)